METILRRTEELISQEKSHSVHNYNPLPVVLKSGDGIFMNDVEGKRYFDFLAAYSAVNQGHCHPRIIDALIQQSQTLTLTSRAFHNEQFGKYAKFITNLFDYDKVLPMNTGVEAVETAMKICRKWAYQKKNVPDDKAVILFATGNFHGRTIGVISASSDHGSRAGFGPFIPGVKQVLYNDITSLETALQDKNVAGFIVEPIQGEAGVIIPDPGYLTAAKALCEMHDVLFVADEIQTGLGRTGKMLCVDHEGVKPDMVLLGKALSGGTIPVSAVLGMSDVMDVIQPGQHGSTYGGSPLGCAVAMTALQVILDEGMVENSKIQGEKLRSRLKSIDHPMIREVRGKGLMNVIEIDSDESSDLAKKLCVGFMENGLLAKPTHGNKIRLTPPLIISSEQIRHAADIIERTILTF